MKSRTYIAIDLKSFYASVECMERGLDPLTTNLVVADLSRTEKTICLAVSPSLKSYGIPGRARLFEVVQKRAFEANQRDANKVVRVLVEGPSKRDESILSGRSPKNVNVHAKVPQGMCAQDLAGQLLDVKVTEAKTWYLLGEVM